MLQTRIRKFFDTVRKGFNVGFVSGAVALFLILIGLPYNLKNLALFLLLLVPFVFGIRLARQLRAHSFGHLIRNTLTMGVVSATMLLLFMALINSWEAKGIDARQYFNAIPTDAMEVLSGVPAEELHPHPPTDPLTGKIVDITTLDPVTKQPVNPDAAIVVSNDVLSGLLGQIDPARNKYTAEVLTPTNLRFKLTAEPPPAGQTNVNVQDLKFKIELLDRTSPMRLTFNSHNALHFKLGFDLNLGIGGLYGFLLTIMLSGLLGAVITRGAFELNVGRYRAEAAASLSGYSAARWALLLLPLVLFALLWLSVKHGKHNPIFNLGGSSEPLQLLITFGVILSGLVALRATRRNDWNLAYPMRVGMCVAPALVLIALGAWQIRESHTYFLATSGKPNGSQTLSVLTLVIASALLVVQNVLALRRPGRFEMQVVGSTVFTAMLLMPLYLNQYQNQVLTIVGINILLGLGLNIVVGYTGLLDLGYVAFLALGAYTYGFLSSKELKFNDLGKPVGLKYAGNQQAVIRLAGWVVIAVVVSLIVVTIGLRLWNSRRLSKPKKSEAHATLIPLPSRPPRNVTVLLAVIAIASSLITVAILNGSGLYHHLFNDVSPFVVGLVVGVVMSALAGILLGIPVLRLRGDYLAIVTLGFGEIIRLMFNNLKDYTGGAQGVLKIPSALPANSFGPVTYLNMTYLVLVGAALVAFVSMRLKQGRIGRAWNAVRSDEDIAQSMGINLVQTKLLAFALGASFGGLGGVLYAARQSNAIPTDYQLNISIQVLSLVIIGGMGSIPGVIIGAIVLIGVPEILRELETYRILVFGALLVVMVIIRPAGILPEPPAQLRERAQNLAGQFSSPEPEEGEA